MLTSRKELISEKINIYGKVALTKSKELDGTFAFRGPSQSKQHIRSSIKTPKCWNGEFNFMLTSRKELISEKINIYGKVALTHYRMFIYSVTRKT